MQEIRNVKMDLLGYKDEREDCTMVYDKYMSYLGKSDANETFDKYGAIIMFSQNPDMLLQH